MSDDTSTRGANHTTRTTICPGRKANPEGLCPVCSKQTDTIIDSLNGDFRFATHTAN